MKVAPISVVAVYIALIVSCSSSEDGTVLSHDEDIKAGTVGRLDINERILGSVRLRDPRRKPMLSENEKKAIQAAINFVIDPERPSIPSRWKALGMSDKQLTANYLIDIHENEGEVCCEFWRNDLVAEHLSDFRNSMPSVPEERALDILPSLIDGYPLNFTVIVDSNTMRAYSHF